MFTCLTDWNRVSKSMCAGQRPERGGAGLLLHALIHVGRRLRPESGLSALYLHKVESSLSLLAPARGRQQSPGLDRSVENYLHVMHEIRTGRSEHLVALRMPG